MSKRDLFLALETVCKGIDIRHDEPLSRHTSFRIGGPAARMAFPRTVEELLLLIQTAKQLDLPWRLLGAGTNVLAPDEGLEELIICTKDALLGLTDLGGGVIRAMAGETLAKTAVFARSLGLTGLEFAHGIPGTVGGGVYMNAGAYGGDICGVCRSVTALTPDGEVREYVGKCRFCYRSSIFERDDLVVISAEFALKPGDPEEIQKTMRELMNKRSASQPLDLPSAGSTFKRPQGAFAGVLVEEAGLKGKGFGGAQVSEKHAGFVVNTDGATAQDVRNTIEYIQKIVKEQSGYDLEPEVRIW